MIQAATLVGSGVTNPDGVVDGFTAPGEVRKSLRPAEAPEMPPGREPGRRKPSWGTNPTDGRASVVTPNVGAIGRSK